MRAIDCGGRFEKTPVAVMPAFCVLAYDTVDIQPWLKSERPNAWGEAKDTTFRIKGHRAGAKYLTSKLIEQDFDVAYAYKPLHESLSHAFTNSVLFLDWDRRGSFHGGLLHTTVTSLKNI